LPLRPSAGFICSIIERYGGRASVVSGGDQMDRHDGFRS
jgi:hypothetical protein